MPSILPLGWIINSSLVAAAVAGLVVVLWERRYKTLQSNLDLVAVIVVVFVSVFVWRAVCNVGALNDDPVTAFSPNDLLCPLFTYLLLGMWSAFRHPADTTQWERLRVILAAAALVVNVLTI